MRRGVSISDMTNLEVTENKSAKPFRVYVGFSWLSIGQIFLQEGQSIFVKPQAFAESCDDHFYRNEGGPSAANSPGT